MKRYLIQSLAAAGVFAGVSAHAQVAVVMSTSSAPLSREQVSNIFLGRSPEFKAVDQPESAAVRATFDV